MDPVPPPISLAYAADLPIRYGISYEMRGDFACIAVPPPFSWGYRTAETIVIIFLALYAVTCAFSTVEALVETKADSSVLFGTCFNVFMMVIFAIAAVKGWQASRRRATIRTVIELNSSRLIVHDSDSTGAPRQRWWHRIDIADIRPGPVPWTSTEQEGLGLHIRIAGKTILEIMPGHPPEVAHWVADRLNEALRAAPTRSQDPAKDLQAT